MSHVCNRQKERISELWKMQGDWVRNNGPDFEWRRGSILGRYGMNAGDWVQHADRFYSTYPIENMRIYGVPDITSEHDQRARRVIFSLRGRPSARFAVDMRAIEAMDGPTVIGQDYAASVATLTWLGRTLFAREWPGVNFSFSNPYGTNSMHSVAQSRFATIRLAPGSRVARAGDVIVSDGRGEILSMPDDEPAGRYYTSEGQRLEPIGIVRRADIVSEFNGPTYQEVQAELFGATWGPSPLANIRIPDTLEAVDIGMITDPPPPLTLYDWQRIYAERRTLDGGAAYNSPINLGPAD